RHRDFDGIAALGECKSHRHRHESEWRSDLPCARRQRHSSVLPGGVAVKELAPRADFLPSGRETGLVDETVCVQPSPSIPPPPYVASATGTCRAVKTSYAVTFFRQRLRNGVNGLH